MAPSLSPARARIAASGVDGSATGAPSGPRVGVCTDHLGVNTRLLQKYKSDRKSFLWIRRLEPLVSTRQVARMCPFVMLSRMAIHNKGSSTRAYVTAIGLTMSIAHSSRGLVCDETIHLPI